MVKLLNIKKPSLMLFICLTFSDPVIASDHARDFISLTFENDVFAGTDAGYTNGIGLTFAKGSFDAFNAENLPDILLVATDELYISTMPHKDRGVAHMFFQRIQTPKDLQATNLIKDDLPYVGLLAWQGTLYAWDSDTSDQLSLLLGAVGPSSYAQEVQSFVHRMLGGEKPKGWKNQIGNEPVFMVEANRLKSLYRIDNNRFQIDIVGLGGVGLGNFQSAASAGIAFRFGRNLQASFSTFSLDADRQINSFSASNPHDYYFFVGGNTSVVLNDVFINGNSFRDSPSIPLQHYQNQLSAGAVWNIDVCELVFQFTSVSAKTSLNDNRAVYGAMSITYRL